LLYQKIAIAKQGGSGLKNKIMAVARSFRNTPYVGGTLDNYVGSEQLIVNLSGLDCWTFVENCTAIALTASDANPSANTYRQHLKSLRYRGGMVRGYGSRLHYFSEWIIRAQERGLLRDISSTLPGARPYDKPITYMTDFPGQYPHIRHDSTRQTLLNAERWLSAQKRFFIPKNSIAAMENAICEGDIIALTSNLSQLDIEHQGFAIRENGRVYLLHASSVGKKQVLISAQPLTAYIARIPAMSGIVVARFF
jgi:Protein of unknown function (DUF1460)